MTDVLFVYVTAPSQEIAKTIAMAVVEEGTAACVNIIGPISSVFSWQGKVEEASEFAMVMKTTQAIYHKLEARIRSLHPYDCPCIIALPVSAGSATFLNWIHASTRSS